MRIGILLDWLDYNNLFAISNYVYNLVKKLLEIDNNNKYFLIHTKSKDINNPYHDIFNETNEIVLKSYNRMSNSIKQHIYRRLILPKILENLNLDIIQELCHIKPITGTRKLKILTIHDVVIRAFPNIKIPLNDRLKWKYNDFIVQRLIKRGVKIIATSEHTKKDIVKYYRITSDRVTVIYHGVDRSVFNEKNKGDYLTVKYNIQKPFILYIGTFHSRKNVDGLINALFKMKQKKKLYPYKLVMVANSFYRDRDIYKSIKNLNLEKEIIIIDPIPLQDLANLYSIADLFVFPSFYEGFGFPVLEAMSSGIPVVSSNRTSLPEIIGSAGILVDPNNINELSESIYKVLKDRNFRKELSQKGIERSKEFSWKITAEKTLKLIESCNSMK